MANARICIIGSSGTDMVIKAEKIPSAGETVLGGEFFMNPGGKGANQAVAAARLGGDVVFIANVGGDQFGEQSIHHFTREGIHTEYISKDNSLPTQVALIMVDKKGENSISVAPGSNMNLVSEQVDRALAAMPTGCIVLIQLEIPPETVEHAVREGKRKGHRVILNPAPARKLPKDIFDSLFFVTPNETEAEILTGIHITDTASAKLAAEKLHKLGVVNTAITLGAKGAYIHSAQLSKLVPAPKVTALDSTAAGDCFSGALAVALAENMAVEDSVAFACQAASLSVTRLGAQKSMPYRKEIK
jgi:ribokinase